MRLLPRFALFSSLLCLVLTGCGSGGSTKVAPTAQISVSPSTVSVGQTSTLTWSTTNATAVSISQGVGVVTASGSKTVSPTTTTTYTITAVGNGGTITDPATVTVMPAAAPTGSLTASPATIVAGQTATLTWATTNATAVSIDQGIGTVAASGTQTVTPTATTTYTLTVTGAAQTVTYTATVTVGAAPLTGILQWKGDSNGNGLYGTETSLTLANVNPTTFGKTRDLVTDGQLLPQPLFVRSVNLGAGGTHDLIIAASENDSVYAFDGETGTKPIWTRSFLDAAAGVTFQTDNHGGRSSFGGEIGITGTPVIDPATGILYVVTATQQTVAGNVVVTDTLHSIDIRTGLDAGAGSVVISATVPGTGEGSVNGQLSFAASQEDQRPGLMLVNGVLYVAFGSFSDFAPFHGWLFAYNPTSLNQLGVFQASPNYRADYDEGSGAAFWNSGAAPSFESDGTMYIVAGNGSTDVENGGVDYGDTVLHLSFANGKFTVLDWFTPFNRDCIDASDIEMGSGGFAVLPDTVAPGRKLGVTLTKEGRLYLLDRTNLGHFNATTDQVVQQFMVGADACDASTTGAAADGPNWNRLYGNASYWNGNLYMVPSNESIRQYSISGTTINPTPVAVGATDTYYRAGNTVVSANGNSNGIVWMYEKTASGNPLLHAYSGTNVGTELWNSNMNATRDALVTGGEGFQVPVVIDGKVIVTSGTHVAVYGLIQ
jgi:hypothetical protein